MKTLTDSALRQLFSVARRFVHNKASVQELKSEVRWLEKRIEDRVQELLEGLGRDPLTEEEAKEFLHGEEPEVIEEVLRRLGEANDSQTT